MSQWRTRGYVQDSDEEDEYDSQETHAGTDANQDNPIDARNTEHDAIHASGRTLHAKGSDRIEESSEDELAQEDPKTTARHFLNPSARIFNPHVTLQVQPADGSRGSQASNKRHDEDNGSFSAGNMASSQHRPWISDETVARTETGAETQDRCSAADTPQNASQKLPASSFSSGPIFRAGSPAEVADDLDELQNDWPRQTSQAQISSSLPAQARSESPLSEIPSSPPDFRTDVESRGERAPFQRQSLVSVVIPRMERPVSVSSEAGNVNDVELARIGRALRKRNPIQLHPYLLENEKYRQSLRARGLKPVKVAAQNARHQHEENRRIEGQTTQDRDFVVDQTQSSEFQHSSQTALRSSPPLDIPTTLPRDELTASEQNHNAMSDSDEFPDLSVLVQRKRSGAIQQGAKRRKTAPTYSRKSLSNRAEQPRPFREAELRVLDIPPSPPPSRTPPVPVEPQVQDRRLRLLPSLSPEQPPTPAVSSSRKPIRRRVVRSDSDDESPQRRPRRPSDHSAVDLVSSDSENDPDEAMQSHLRRLQKRIKGVLPASWLRLDYQAQAEKERERDQLPNAVPRARRKSALSRTPSVRTGVTVTRVHTNHRRPTSTAGDSTTHAGQTRPLDLFSDGSEADMPVAEAISSGAREESEPDLDFDENLISQGGFEAPEHDWVDPMLPSGSRNRSSNKSKRKKQTRLTDTLYSRKRMRLDKSEASPHTAVPRAPSSRTRGRRENRARNPYPHKSRAPRLSVLDAPVFQTSRSEQLPAFLRVAARSVRHRVDKGRRSPKMKHIRLQTAADTEDANSVLREWRAGTILPSAQPDFRIPKLNHPDSLDSAGRETLQQLPAPEKISGDHRVQIEDESASPQQKPKKGLRQMQLKHVQSLTKSGLAPRRNQDAQKRKGEHLRISKNGLKQPDYRTAQLEGLEDDYDRRHRAAAFKKSLSKLNRNFVDNLRSGATVTNPQLSKFLEDKDEVIPLPIGQSRLENAQELNNVRPDSEPESRAPVRPPRKGRMKRPAQRVDTEAREYRQPSEPLPQYLDDQPIPMETEQVEADCLVGLGPYGTRYSTDFDVLPLSMGTFFHESTFIGGGELKAVFDLKDRDINTPTKALVLNFNGKTFRWGAWTDEVASDLGSLWSTVVAGHGKNRNPDLAESQEDIFSGTDCLCLLRKILRFVSVHLYFLDPVDRRSFVLYMFNLLEMVSAKLLPNMATSKISFSGQDSQSIAVRAAMFLGLVTFQTLQIANNTIMDSSIKNDLELLFKNVMGSLLKAVLKHGMVDLRRYLDDNRRHLVRERGIHEDDLAIEVVVVSGHVLNFAKISQFSFWGLVREELLPPIQSSRHIATFERAWYDIFTLLPYFEFDTVGVLRSGRRYQTVQGDWSLGMPLLSRVLKLYPGTSQKPGVFVNGYLRSCLCRCHCLVQNWNWKLCEPALTTTFDFFSHRGFNNLQNEESKGSPRFLHMLNQHPSLVIQPDDRTFHVFLKTLAVGLKALRSVYNEKQIRNVSWRLVPNHRRSYRKEEALHQQDLEGLRNQHDLLCTLYWASPPKSRAGLTFLRNLVDQTASHREVCRLSVKAWSVLAKFQISTDEGITALEPFSEWFQDIVTQNLAQHRFARSEAEAQYEAMKFQGHDHISPQQLQMTIKTNQSQILATILDAVVGLKMAISAAPDVEIAAVFLQDSAVWDLFKLFDAKSVDVISLMVEVVEVFQAFMQIVENKDNESSGESQQTEDSQDYGEWPDLEDEGLVPRQSARPSGPPMDFLQDSLWHMLSTCFGADVPPDDKLLTKVVEAWTRLAGRLVRIGKKEWDSYLDAYGANSWRQLQDTGQTRKYRPYFMALVMERNSTSYEQHKQDFLTSWMLCLVERESMLKFQHRFTSALLNADPEHPLLQNLPFLKNSEGLIDIKLSEFRERRLSLISTILANMRDAYDEAIQTGHDDLPGLRRELSHLLKQLMNTMKRNYQELQQETSVKGSYVAFVQSVVEFLQQYISEIHPIDKFFTDSSVFPLPATDPTYVVGRLKSYTSKLSTPRTLKQLVTFVKTVTERAAFDTQQAYLVSQFHVAVSKTFEHGPTTTLQPSYVPTLRHVLLRAIFPAYIAQCVSQNGLISSILLSAPILEATALFFSDLPISFSATDPRSCTVTTAMLAAVLDALLAGPLALLTTQTRLLELPHVLRTVALLLHIVQASVPAATYIALRTGSNQGAGLVKRILSIRKCALWISSIVLGAEEIDAGVPDRDLDEPVDDPELVVPLSDRHASALTEQDEQDRQEREARLLSDIRGFCEKEVKESLEGGEWIRVSSSVAAQRGQADLEADEERQDVYIFTRGGNRREVQVATCSVARGKQEVVQAVEALWAVCETCGIAVDAGLAVGVDATAQEEFDLRSRRARDVVFPGEKDEVVII
ncbi:Mus7/MMS22 family-domain-containing protein [Phyllosticta citricarpa]|uniref:Mus7/MMS22 family-domain-containing protein n=1 Tax=Phyllosticta citricarpa TaxID=55181 RepID=A0ABR1MLX5_9PEZI